MHYIFVINGRKDYAHVEPDVMRQLEQLDINYTIYVTTGVGDATRYTRIYCDLHHAEEVCFVACGGSGTTNEVASGIVGQPNKTMAILQYGVTNDLLKMFPNRDFRSVAKILQGSVTNIDVIKVNDSYALNTINFGFDSVVATEFSYLNETKSKYPIERGIVRALVWARFNRIKVTADGIPLNRWLLLSCAIGNGRCVAGDFLCAPNADVYDGLMDITLLKPMSFLRFVLLLPHYKRGEHTQPKYSRRVICCRARKVEITSPHLINVVLDGELLPGTKFTVEVLPQSMRLLLPPQEN